MRFAKIVFTTAAAWGFLVLPPMYFLEQKIGRDTPPAITHPEYFYGFIGIALAWQLAFFIIGRDPVRYRPLMIPCMIEKFSFTIACSLLYSSNRIPQQMFGASLVDMVLGTLFVIAFIKTAGTPKSRAASA
jgi:hypothetical protein